MDYNAVLSNVTSTSYPGYTLVSGTIAYTTTNNATGTSMSSRYKMTNVVIQDSAGVSTTVGSDFTMTGTTSTEGGTYTYTYSGTITVAGVTYSIP